jgi:hypothetical protein
VTRRRAVLLAAVALAGAAVWVAVQRPLAVVGTPPSDGFHRLSGVVHVHTTASDGAGTPEEVVAAARRAGLGFVVLTDHNVLDAKRVEGSRDGLLVLVGTEISTTAGHVLGVGIPDPGFRFSGDAGDALEDVRDLGGAAFAAHPDSDRPDFRWTGDALPGPWGLEVLNGDSAARSAGALRLARAAVFYPLNPRLALVQGLRRPDATLARWDALSKERDVPAIAGADAHARIPIRKNLALPFPGYEALFSVARVHVVLDRPLTGRFDQDAAALVDALRRGRSSVGVDGLAPAGEVSFVARAGERVWTMGDTAPPSPGLRLQAGGRAPQGTRFVLFRDGVRASETPGGLDVAVPGPGVYRVEAYVPGHGMPWVITNAIVVADEATAAARARRAAWPEPPPAPPAAEVLDDFEGKTVFEPASDPGSTLERPVLDPSGGLAGGGAARLRYRLGTEGASPYVALVHQGAKDLTGRRGLVFAVKGDGVHRLYVQVRDLNPASADEGTEWWFASVKTSTEWRRVAVPFERLRSINPKTDGRLDLDEVRAVIFLVDKGVAPLGSGGTVWLDEVGWY